MKIKNQILVFLLACTILSCKDNGTNQQLLLPHRPLSLSASANNIVAPVDITFTGTFHAYSDTMKMHVPDFFLMGGPGLTVIRYALPDTTVAAKQAYGFVQHFPHAGLYSMYMVLQTLRGDVFSDTLVITIR